MDELLPRTLFAQTGTGVAGRVSMLVVFVSAIGQLVMLLAGTLDPAIAVLLALILLPIPILFQRRAIANHAWDARRERFETMAAEERARLQQLEARLDGREGW